MRLPSFLRSTLPADESARAAPRRAPASDDTAGVDAARTHARRRLAGALVLLVIGVVGFPLLFETQPRPLPVDTPIRIAGVPVTSAPVATPPPPAAPRRVPAMPPAGGLDVPAAPGIAASARGRRGGDAVTAAPPPVATLPVVVEPAAPKAQAAAAPAAQGVPPAVSAGPRDAVAPAPRAAVASAPATATATATVQVTGPATLPRAASASTPQPRAAVASAPAPRAAASTAQAVDDPTHPRALLDASVAASSAAPRYVVQVGAYTDAALLRDARAKVEKAGLKTYTQVIENDAGRRTRVRLGPYATREEADAAATKVKRTGLPAAIVKL